MRGKGVCKRRKKSIDTKGWYREVKELQKEITKDRRENRKVNTKGVATKLKGKSLGHADGPALAVVRTGKDDLGT